MDYLEHEDLNDDHEVTVPKKVRNSIRTKAGDNSLTAIRRQRVRSQGAPSRAARWWNGAPGGLPFYPRLCIVVTYARTGRAFLRTIRCLLCLSGLSQPEGHLEESTASAHLRRNSCALRALLVGRP